MFNEVMVLTVMFALTVFVLAFPVGVALATARAAERVVKARGGGRIDHVIAAVTSIGTVLAVFVCEPVLAFALSAPLLVYLCGLEKRSLRHAEEVPHAVARRAG